MSSKFTKIKPGKNPFGLSDLVWGCSMLLAGALCDGCASIMLDVAEDDGVSSNAITLYASCFTLLLSIMIDAYYWYVGYAGGQHWFVILDIFKQKQRDKFVEIAGFWKWFLVALFLTWVLTFVLIAAFIFVTDVGDAIAIADGYVVLVPIFGLCFKTGEDWKHRYILCLIIIIIGIIFVAKPGFIFGYTQHVNATHQFIGCLLSLICAIGTAISTVAYVMLKKLAYDDLLKQRSEILSSGKFKNIQAHPSDQTPLIGNEIYDANGANTQADSLEDPDDAEIEIKENSSSTDSDETASNIVTGGEIDVRVKIESNEFIVENDWGLTILFLEFASILQIVECLLFSQFDEIKTSDSTQWFWQDFDVSYGGSGSKCAWYTLGGAFFWCVESYLMTLGTFKVANAPIVAMFDITDIFFTFVLSYVWLHEHPNTYDIVGSIIIIIAIIGAVYPWQNLIQLSKYKELLKNF